MTNKTVSVVGLGKLGLPMAGCFAAKGFTVVGADANPRQVEAVNSGIPLIHEPGLKELLQAGRGRLTATQDTEAAVAASDVTFIVVPTPSAPEGGFSLQYVLSASEAIGRVLRTKQDFHLVVLTSTVMPGSTGGAVRSSLEKATGKHCGTDFGLCYSPEFIALGSVIRDFLNPDFLLIGESDPHSGEILESLYQQVCENHAPVARMRFINAELTKLAVNTFVTTKITFANMLAHICERLPGAQVDVVTSALGLDSRIGRKYLKGAIGYGGPCFPRDNLALASLGRQLGVPVPLAEATDRANRDEVGRLVDVVMSKLPPSGVAGILGLSYKPGTDVTEESQGLQLAKALITQGVETIVYDPAAMENACTVLGARAKYAASATECAQQSDVVVIATPWDEFYRILPEAPARSGRPRVVIDCWRILDREKYGRFAEYVPLGECAENPGKES